MVTSLPNEHLARFEVESPNIDHIIIDDGEPVDNVYSEKQQRLLTEPLYSSWQCPRPFVALANVGLFASPNEPPLVPDMMLSLDVHIHPDFVTEKRHRTYFMWEMGKTPDVVVEVVSNRDGGELGKRKLGYGRWRIPYYVVWDPHGTLGHGEMLWSFESRGDLYVSTDARFESVGLELRPWDGAYEGVEARWLRWFSLDGELVQTGAERAGAAQRDAEAAQRDAEAAQRDAEAAQRDAEAARAETERLARLLREHGIDPTS